METKKIKVKLKHNHRSNSDSDMLIKTEMSFLTRKRLEKKDLVPSTKSSILPVIQKIIAEIGGKLIVRPKITIFGRECCQNRDVGFFSNESIGYKYSNQIMSSQELSENMILLLEFINYEYKSNYNGILINMYKSGEQSIGAHSDDETTLDKNGVIALSYGAERKFRIRDKKTKKIYMDIPLEHLSIIQMGGQFQKEFTHEVPVEKKVKECRISFTFRKHLI